MEPKAETKTTVIQLDPIVKLRIELVETKKQLNKAEEEKLMLLLQGVRREAQVLQEEASKLLAAVLQSVGQPGKSLRLIDREKGTCVVE